MPLCSCLRGTGDRRPMPYAVYLQWCANLPTEEDIKKAKEALARPACRQVIARLNAEAVA
jgi:hypothetical protein